MSFIELLTHLFFTMSDLNNKKDVLYYISNVHEARLSFILIQGLRMNTFITSAMNVSARSITKAAVYPPVASRTRFDTVAISEPAMTVKVMKAMLVGKYFIPKKDEVNAAVMVGQEP